MITKNDLPQLAIGHMGMESASVPATVRFFDDLGARVVMSQDAFAIVELRGGTHVVIRGVRDAPTNPSFDLMVDDVPAVRDGFERQGYRPSKIRRGGVHESFHVEEPGGATLTFTSSHVMGRV